MSLESVGNPFASFQRLEGSSLEQLQEKEASASRLEESKKPALEGVGSFFVALNDLHGSKVHEAQERTGVVRTSRSPYQIATLRTDYPPNLPLLTLAMAGLVGGPITLAIIAGALKKAKESSIEEEKIEEEKS